MSEVVYSYPDITLTLIEISFSNGSKEISPFGKVVPPHEDYNSQDVILSQPVTPLFVKKAVVSYFSGNPVILY